MNLAAAPQNKTSLEFLEVINDFRLKAGEAIIPNNKFLSKLEDELDLDRSVSFLYQPPKGGTAQAFHNLDSDQMLLVGMRESKAVRKSVLEWINTLQNVSSVPALPDFGDPKVIAALLTTVQDTQQENKRLNGICNDLASQLSSGITAPQFAKLLNGVNSQQIQSFLVNKEYLKQYTGGELRGTRVISKGRNSGYFVQKWLSRKDFKVGSVVVTEKGARWLYSQYQKGNLPMLKTWDGSRSHDLFMGEAPIVNAPALKAVK